MRRLSHNILTVAAFFFIIPLTGMAQQKMGYVNTDDILAQIPEYKGVQQQLSVMGSDWRQKLDDMQQRIDTLREEYQAKEILYTDELRAEKKQQIQDLVDKRKQFMNEKFGPQGDYFRKQKELLEPIQRRVYEAIQTVAERQNIDFVFDRANSTSLLYGRNRWNLNQDVLQELGITLSK